MKLHGNKATTLQFDGVRKVIGDFHGTAGWKSITKLMTRDEARSFGIQDDSELVTDDKGNRGFVWAPVHTWSDVKIMLDGFSSSRSSTQQARNADTSFDMLQEGHARDIPKATIPVVVPESSFVLANEIGELKKSESEQTLPSHFDPLNPATWVVPNNSFYDHQ